MMPDDLADKYHLAVQKIVTDFDLLHLKDTEGYRRYLMRDMARILADAVLEQARITEDYDVKSGGTRIRADVYVFSPNDFWRVVRLEAARMFERMMNVPTRHLQENVT